MKITLKSKSGQATTEMAFLLPILIMLAGAAMFFVYACWQGIKVQQAANLAARVQGEEKVGGGISIAQIHEDNGTSDLTVQDCDPTLTAGRYTGAPCQAPAGSVYDKYAKLVKGMFGADVQGQLYVPPPQEGQNFDKVKVVRTINLPKLPFLTWPNGMSQIKIEGDAWGGEDTFMYGLPRWGKTSNSGGCAEWKNLVGGTNQQGGC